MLGLEPSRLSPAIPESDRIALQLARLAISLLLLGAVIAGLLC